jgi:hypothetical protein
MFLGCNANHINIILNFKFCGPGPLPRILWKNYYVANAECVWYDNISRSKYQNHRLTLRKAGKRPEEPKNQKGKYANPSAVSQKLGSCRDRHSFIRAYNRAGESIRCRRTE